MCYFSIFFFFVTYSYYYALLIKIIIISIDKCMYGNSNNNINK